MSCKYCEKFPVQSSNFEELEVNLERHSTLYRCKKCANYFELIEEERSIRTVAVEVLKEFYPKTYKENR